MLFKENINRINIGINLIGLNIKNKVSECGARTAQTMISSRNNENDREAKILCYC